MPMNFSTDNDPNQVAHGLGCDPLSWINEWSGSASMGESSVWRPR